MRSKHSVQDALSPALSPNSLTISSLSCVSFLIPRSGKADVGEPAHSSWRLSLVLPFFPFGVTTTLSSSSSSACASDYEIVLLDFGLCCRLRPQVREAYTQLWAGLATARKQKMAKASADLMKGMMIMVMDVMRKRALLIHVRTHPFVTQCNLKGGKGGVIAHYFYDHCTWIPLCNTVRP